MRQESVLLSFVETVDFIHEEYGASTEIPVGLGALDNCFDVFLASGDGGDFDEVGFEFVGKDAGESGLAGAGRTPKNKIDGFALSDDFGKDFAVTDDVCLAENIIEFLWTHAFSKWDAIHILYYTRTFAKRNYLCYD